MVKRSIAMLLVLISISFSKLPSPDAHYPRLVLNPQTPDAGQAVEISYVKGLHNNGCIPSYSTIVVQVEQSVLAIYPPIYNVYLTYDETWPQQQMCTQVMAEYGFDFTLRNVKHGTYNVIDENDVVGSFRVRQKSSGPISLRGKVVDDPFPMKRMPQPIGDAKVYLQKENYAIIQPYTTQQPNATDAVYLPYLTIDSATTNDNGDFAFEIDNAGSYRLLGRAEKFKPNTLSLNLLQDTSVTIKLLASNAFATIDGRVTTMQCPQNNRMGMPCHLKPVAQCTVHVTPPLKAVPLQAQRGDLLQVSYRAVTDADGYYSLDVPLSHNEQVFQATARKSGYSPETESFSLSNGYTKTVDFNLDKVYAVSAKSRFIDHTPAMQPVRITNNGVDLRVAREGRISLHAYRADGSHILLLNSRHLQKGLHNIAFDKKHLNGFAVLVLETKTGTVTCDGVILK
ncbi:MAG: hypothetical protein GF398_08455 [Chitinivibrionales bacterium]|nr:hypothetical protein [Chitinivibrionales bacterium]